MGLVLDYLASSPGECLTLVPLTSTAASFSFVRSAQPGPWSLISSRQAPSSPSRRSPSVRAYGRTLSTHNLVTATPHALAAALSKASRLYPYGRTGGR